MPVQPKSDPKKKAIDKTKEDAINSDKKIDDDKLKDKNALWKYINLINLK